MWLSLVTENVYAINATEYMSCILRELIACYILENSEFITLSMSLLINKSHYLIPN